MVTQALHYEIFLKDRVFARTDSPLAAGAYFQYLDGTPHARWVECDRVRLSDRMVQGLVSDLIAARSTNCIAGTLPGKRA